MITNVILTILAGLVSWLASLLPQWSLHLPGTFLAVISMLKSFDWLLPVSETLTCSAIIVTAVGLSQGIKWSVKLIDWIADVLP